MSAIWSSQPVAKFYLDTSTASVTSAWQTVLTNAATDINTIETFTASGSAIELGYGSGTASVTSFNYLVIPGGQAGRVGLLVNQSTNVFMRTAINTTISTGLIIFNFLR